MKVFRNRSVAKSFFTMLAILLLSSIIIFLFHRIAGILFLIFGGMVCVFYLADSAKRYRQIAETTEEIDRILHGEEDMKFSHYEEGELEILHAELRKLTIRLKEQNELLQKEKMMLADSLADISHQLRTPLMAVNLNLAILGGNSLDQGERREILEDIKRQNYRIDRLISSLLKLARLDAGAVILKKEKISLLQVVKTAADPLAISMDIKEQTLSLDVEGEFLGDFDWTVEAVGNLLKNCTEHMGNGVITVTGRENAIYTQLIIHDAGTGFSEKDLPHLFERFYRGENSPLENAGIGLSLAKRIINMQNGSITASNHPNGGAVFTLRFYKSVI